MTNTNTLLELHYWQQRWFMDNLPPLPFTNYVSPHFDPYEMDPNHYNSSIEYIFQPDGYDTYDTVDAPNTTVYSDTDTDTEDDFY